MQQSLAIRPWLKLRKNCRQISTAKPNVDPQKSSSLFQELVEKERLETEVAGSDLGIWGYTNSYWKYGHWNSWFIVDLPVKHGDFPWLCEFSLDMYTVY